MIWACSAASGPGPLAIMEGKINSQVSKVCQDTCLLTLKALDVLKEVLELKTRFNQVSSPTVHFLFFLPLYFDNKF